MPELLTLQDLANGHLDVQALGEAANGDENTIVTTRTGNTYPSAERAINIMFQNGGLPAKMFGTYTGMTASDLPVGSYAAVTNDPDANKVGLYTFVSGNWLKVKYSPDKITQDVVLKELAVFRTDFFKKNTVQNGYYKITGEYVDADTWETTPLIPVKTGQTINFLGKGNVSVVSSVSSFDSNGNFIESLYANTTAVATALVISNPSVSYVRGSAVKADSHYLTTYEVGSVAASTPSAKEYSVIEPTQVYALKNEPIYLYADGIVGNADNVAWNISESNQTVCKVTPTTITPGPVKLTTVNEKNEREQLAAFDVLVTDVPKNPLTKRYVIALGDSLTDGVANSGIQGAWVNECSRRLNGVGYELLTGALSPAPLTLTNIEFIGTKGDKAVKHEGRGGWKASDYLNLASITTNTNAFWNPATSQFDLDYYLTQNGFTGVSATGSNLTITILLGWNDAYKYTSASATTNLGLLIDKIKSAKSATDIIVIGLNQAPDINFKPFTGERFLSRREIFETVKEFNDAYKAMIATKTNVDFLQLSCVFNSEIGYNMADYPVSSRSTTTVKGTTDHLHPNATGYAMLADCVFYKLLYKYCR